VIGKAQESTKLDKFKGPPREPPESPDDGGKRKTRKR
jgi:hypothetical protein